MNGQKICCWCRSRDRGERGKIPESGLWMSFGGGGYAPMWTGFHAANRLKPSWVDDHEQQGHNRSRFAALYTDCE